MRDELCPAAAKVLEGECVDGDVPGHAFPLECPDDLRGRDDFAILAAESVFLNTIRPAMHEAILPAGTKVHLADLERVPARAPPHRKMLAFAVRLEDEVARRVELAGHHNLYLRWSCDFELLLFDHASPPPSGAFGRA